MNVLFATSEIHPLIKTGGLADVASYLPRALQSQGASIRVIVPAYASLLAALPNKSLKTLTNLKVGKYQITIKTALLPTSKIRLWLVDCPLLFGQAGGPYQDEQGVDWPNNAERFAIFAKTIVILATESHIPWPVDIVHCNDWQTGLVPALLKKINNAPTSVFTIHNLAYQGLYSYETFLQLDLPEEYWSYHALEFYGQLSFIKGGLIFADKINTVSPQYAIEIQTPEFGSGVDTILTYRKNSLNGILNGINNKDWNPNHDHYLTYNYNVKTLQKKAYNKLELQKTFQLKADKNIPVLGMVSRLSHQKGCDLVLDIMDKLATKKIQIIILGSGDKTLEAQLQNLAAQYPKVLSVKITYDESLSHQIIAGADMFLMPSRFEPCGLTQMYSLRYGTIPIAHYVGGLVNTIIDSTDASIEAKTATGVLFGANNNQTLLEAIERGLALYKNKSLWKQLQATGMKQDYSWKSSATEYMRLYSELLSK